MKLIKTETTSTKQSPWKPDWFQHTEVFGPYQIPILRPTTLPDCPEAMASFCRQPPLNRRQRTLLHGYLDDPKLLPLLKAPEKSLERFATYFAVTTPDFSLCTEMPLQDRIRSTWSNRALGAYFQQHGLRVVPSIRWAHLSDLEYVLDGLSAGGTIVLSTQGLMRDQSLRKTFEVGTEIVLQELRPKQVIIYGQLPHMTHQKLSANTEIWRFSTDISRIYRTGNI
jgi:hypothetical protein